MGFEGLNDSTVFPKLALCFCYESVNKKRLFPTQKSLSGSTSKPRSGEFFVRHELNSEMLTKAEPLFRQTLFSDGGDLGSIPAQSM